MKMSFEQGGLHVDVSESAQYGTEARATLHTNERETIIQASYFPHDPRALHGHHEFISLRASVIGDSDTPTGTVTLFCSVEQACKLRDELDEAIKQAPSPDA